MFESTNTRELEKELRIATYNILLLIYTHNDIVYILYTHDVTCTFSCVAYYLQNYFLKYTKLYTLYMYMYMTYIVYMEVYVQLHVKTLNALPYIAPRPSTTHPLVWVEPHRHYIYIHQLTCARLTSLTQSFPINPSNIPKIPSCN